MRVSEQNAVQVKRRLKSRIKQVARRKKSQERSAKRKVFPVSELELLVPDPNKPKGARNAYNFFSASKSKEIKEANPGQSHNPD